MSICKNPSSAACLKFNPRPGLNFCQACGAAASALGIGTQSVASQSPLPSVQPQYQQPTSAGTGTKFVQVSKPVLNKQALKGGLMASLHAQRSQRIPATITSGLMAASGVLLGLGLALVVINIVDSGESPNSALAFFAGVFCLFLAWTVANWLPHSFKPTAVAAVNILVPVTAIATATSQLREGNLGLVLLFAGLLSAVMWVLPGTAGRPSLQAFGIGYITVAFIAFSVQSNVSRLIRELSNFDFEFELVTEMVRESGSLVLFFGAIVLGVGHQLDRKLWPNVATPFISIGVALVLAGAWSWLASFNIDNGGSNDSGTAILITLVSVAITYVGGFAGRRFTLGLGIWLVTGGLVGLVVYVSPDDPSIMTVAMLMLIFSAIVSFVVYKLEPKISKMTIPKP